MSKPISITRKTLAIFWRFTRVHTFLFWYATIGSVLSTIVSDILPPLIIAFTFNKLQWMYSQHQTMHFADIQWEVIAYIAVTIGSLVFWRTQAYCAWKYMILSKKEMLNHIFNHLQQMDTKFPR